MKEFKIQMKQLTHNDLDGIGSVIPLYQYSRENNIDFSYDNLGYDDITNTLKNFTPGNYNFITDLNFSEEDLKILFEIVKNNSSKRFAYFDHHEYNEEQLKILEEIKKLGNFHYILDQSMCAAKITFLKFKDILNDQELIKNMESLIHLIDTYDTWKTEREEFQDAFMLDKVYWGVVSNYSIHEFLFRLYKNSWKIPEGFEKIKENLLKLREKTLKELEENDLIIKNDKIFFMPNTEYISDARFIYPGFALYIGAKPNGSKISIRIDENYPNLKDYIVENLKNNPEILSIGGHKFAFGITLKSGDLDKQLQLVEKIFLLGIPNEREN